MADDDTNGVTDGRPKAIKSLTGWIGGATAVVVALGGLAGAYRNIFPSEPARTQVDQNETTPADTATPTNTAAQTDPDQTTVTAYTTDDGGNLSLTDGMWVWVTKDGSKYRYKEVSNDGTTTVAVSKGSGENGKDVYLRWPNAGGQAFQSYDDQETWTDPVKFTVQS